MTFSRAHDLVWEFYPPQGDRYIVGEKRAVSKFKMKGQEMPCSPVSRTRVYLDPGSEQTAQRRNRQHGQQRQDRYLLARTPRRRILEAKNQHVCPLRYGYRH